jgi:hypothetical protein
MEKLTKNADKYRKYLEIKNIIAKILSERNTCWFPNPGDLTMSLSRISAQKGVDLYIFHKKILQKMLRQDSNILDLLMNKNPNCHKITPWEVQRVHTSSFYFFLKLLPTIELIHW